MSEIVLGIGSLLMFLAPIVVVVWILSILLRMERDLSRVAEAVEVLAERAARRDDVRP